MNVGVGLTLVEMLFMSVRVLFVSIVLGPAVFGLLFAVFGYGVSVAGGEDWIEKLVIFPGAIYLAIVFAGIPGAILGSTILIYRFFIGPLNARALFLVSLISSTVLASGLLWFLNANDAYAWWDTVIGSVLVGALYGVLISCIVMAFCQMRNGLGLRRLAE